MFRLWGFKFWSPTDLYIYCADNFTFSMAMAHLSYMAFSDNYLINYSIAGIIAAVILVIKFLSYEFTNWIFAKNENLRKLVPRKILVIFSLVIMVICSLVPRILVFWIGWNYHQLLLLKFLFLCLPLFLFINYHNLIKCDIEVRWTLLPIFCHLAMLIISLRLAKIYSTDMWDTVAIVFIQILFTPLCYASTLDLFLIYCGNAEWTNVAPPPVDAVAPPTVDVVELKKNEPEVTNLSLLPCPKCYGCQQEYTLERVAMIIRECGHSICTDCVKRAASYHNNHFLNCPFCQLPSVIHGNLGWLHTNFAVMKYVSDIARMREELEKSEAPEVPPEIID